MSADPHDPPRLRDLWEQQASNWTRWSREPGHDAYWRFHRDAFLRLVPAPGRLTLDIGCGEGRLLRDLAQRGHHVVGLDAAPTMVRGAHDAAPELAVVNGDAAALPFRDAVADLIVAFMSLQDVDDMLLAVHEAARVLEKGGALCMAVVHPLNSAGTFSGREPQAPFVVDGSYLESRRYHDEIERDGLPMTFHSHHRPLEEYSRALEDAGMVVEAIREVTVDEATVASNHSDARWQRVPLFLHLRARASVTKLTRHGKEAIMPAKGSAEWKGDVPTGTGTFTAGDTISGGYTYKSRFEDGPGSNPEQLIAAAHAACFSMALSNILAESGTPPDSVHTDATVTLRLVDGLPTITRIALVTVGRVPGLDEGAFVEHALAAKAGCPVSRALAGVPEITLEASLAP